MACRELNIAGLLLKRGAMQWPLPARPMDFLFRKFDQLIEVPLVTCLQEGITEHRA